MGASQSAEPKAKKTKTPSSQPMSGSEVVGSVGISLFGGRQVTRDEHRVRAAEAAARRAGAGRSLGSTIALELAIQVDSAAAKRLRDVGLANDQLPKAVDAVEPATVGTKRQREEEMNHTGAWN
jgi:hypothetical protein